MAKKLKLNEIAAYRKELGLNQQTFWNPLGVTQSGGSRYEGGRNVPPTVARLLLLREQGLMRRAGIEVVFAFRPLVGHVSTGAQRGGRPHWV